MTNDEVLSDRLAIQDVLSTYCRGIDRLDQQKCAEAYWPDATDDHGVFSGAASEFVPFIMDFMAETYSATSHRLGQSLVELEQENARAETYFSSIHRLHGSQGHFESVTGRYMDRLQKRAGVWKILERVVIVDFLLEFDSDDSRLAGMQGITLGQHGGEDPSYKLFSD